MSQSYTYDQLDDSIQAWEAEDEASFTAEVPNFISTAETRVLTDLNLTIFDFYDTGSLVTVASDREVAKTDDWFVTRDLWVVVSDARIRLEERTKGYCMDFAPDPTEEGQPKYFYEQDVDTWYVVPTPDDAYAVDALVGVRPTGLSVSNQTTWLGTHCGHLLHSIAMRQAARFLKKFDKAAQFEAQYQNDLATARLELRSLIRSDYNPTKTQQTV